MNNKTNCEKCGECCKYIVMPLNDEPDIYSLSNYKFLLAHENIWLGIDFIKEEWVIIYLTKCKYLSSNNECEIYKDRFLVCKMFDSETCLKHLLNSDTGIIFKSEDELQDFFDADEDEIF